jgi:hypothetical protein
MIYKRDILKAVEIAVEVCAEVSDDRIVLRQDKIRPFVTILQLELLDIVISEMQRILDRTR